MEQYMGGVNGQETRPLKTGKGNCGVTLALGVRDSLRV